LEALALRPERKLFLPSWGESSQRELEGEGRRLRKFGAPQSFHDCNKSRAAIGWRGALPRVRKGLEPWAVCMLAHSSM
jgi:hypothetical protein